MKLSGKIEQIKGCPLKINLAKSAGFCFGVKRALGIAYKTAISEKNVYMLGDIVHNEDVIKKIEKAGIKKIKKLNSGKNKTLLIRAHGTGKGTIAKAKKLGYKIIDATCPMVKEIHKIAAKQEWKGYKIAIIGDKKHDEVQGIIGQLNKKTFVIDVSNRIPETIQKIKKASVVVQSTQNEDKVLKIVEKLKKHIKDLKFFNTICKPTRTKQEEIKTMPRENDVMIIIGSKTSANTKRLFEISKSLNKRSYWVQSEEGINPVWFRNVKSVGVTAGASTPDETTKEVIKFLENIRS